jgi:hypothetical protein
LFSPFVVVFLGNYPSRLGDCQAVRPGERELCLGARLGTLHYSDDFTDYPLLFQLWSKMPNRAKPVDLEKLEQGLRAARIPLKADKEAWKVTDPRKWRGYLLGVWQRRQKSHPEICELYDSKLIIAQDLLQQWVEAHPDWKLPVTFLPGGRQATIGSHNRLSACWGFSSVLQTMRL